ncbi:MAG: hypothetical protein JWO60_1650 [Frankiales bacterium]|nr:hypothetical protein [Frankiales bacterium]
MTLPTIEIHQGDLATPYETLGLVRARKGAQPTPFNRRPSEAVMDGLLRKKAARLGADAVIQVSYVPGIIPSSWRGMTATGIAVKRC